MKRRDFLKSGAVAGLGLALPGCAPLLIDSSQEPEVRVGTSLVASTWRFGVPANKKAVAVLDAGGSVIDAVEQGVMVTESDPKVTTVGYGGRPNREGIVEVDAAIMNGDNLECGSVAGVQGILHPVSVARLVMEKTRHVMLVGDGAQAIAVENGHEIVDLLTEESKREWKLYLEKKNRPAAPEDDHDTIGLIAIDRDGNMAAACTTSGMAWKIPGRVGDSPLIGAGLYCDSDAGGAVATGMGEEVIKVCGSYQVVEFMRQGRTPDEAIRAVLERMVARDEINRTQMVGFVAVRKDGEVGHGCTTKGFQTAVSRGNDHQLLDSPEIL